MEKATSEPFSAFVPPAGNLKLDLVVYFSQTKQGWKRHYGPEDLCGEEWERNDEEIAALDLQGAASPMEVEGGLPDMNAEEMAGEGLYLVKSVIRHLYCQELRFLTLWEGF